MSLLELQQRLPKVTTTSKRLKVINVRRNIIRRKLMDIARMRLIISKKQRGISVMLSIIQNRVTWIVRILTLVMQRMKWINTRPNFVMRHKPMIKPQHIFVGLLTHLKSNSKHFNTNYYDSNLHFDFNLPYYG